MSLGLINFSPDISSIEETIIFSLSDSCISAEYLSKPSIIADASACFFSAPLPAYTLTAPSCALGLIAEKTGIPTLSRSVMSVILVIPAVFNFSSLFFSVSSG